MFTGQSPRLTWRPNAGGRSRRITEVIPVARRYGVNVADDVVFIVDRWHRLDKDTMARGPVLGRITVVRWTHLLNKNGMIPFLIRREILKSDEAIVAVVGHEMFELEELRRIMEDNGQISVADFINHTRPGLRANLHDQAWEYADHLVTAMRDREQR